MGRETAMRAFKREDATEVASLIERVVRDSNRGLSPAMLKALCAAYTPGVVEKLAEGRHHIVVLDDKKIVGTGSMKKNQLQTIYVDPPYQKQGIGSDIVS